MTTFIIVSKWSAVAGSFLKTVAKERVETKGIDFVFGRTDDVSKSLRTLSVPAQKEI